MIEKIVNKDDFKNYMEKYKLDKEISQEAKNVITKALKDACISHLDEFGDNENFRFACYVGSWRKYAYYMGNKNHLIVIYKENRNFDDIKNKTLGCEEIKDNYVYEQLELFNGYNKTKLSKKFVNDYVEYSTDTDIYKYVELAGWLEESDYERAKRLCSGNKDRIEIHHINGDSADNSVNNLIYIPNTIHCEIHSK